MSAFGNPWGDIDKTKEGAPYVVSDDGWGWLGLAILALVPVVFMGFALQGMANFISSHPIWIIVGYILLTLGIGAISYKRKTGLWNVLGMVATSISFLPILLTEMLVEIPSIVRAGDSVGGMIELLIEWIFITLMVVGIAVFVHAVNMLTISPVRHLIMGLPNLQHIDDGVNFGRSLGLKVFAGLQSIEQLFETYGEIKGRNLVAGFSSIFAFKANDVSTRDYIRSLYGSNIILEQYQGMNKTLIEDKREGNTVEDWDLNSLKVGEAVVGLPFEKPFKFYFDNFG